MRTLLTFLCVCCCSILSVSASDLDEISLLARSGTPALAIHLLEQKQPELEHDPESWMEWEQRRIEIYQANAQWDAVIERLTLVYENVLREKMVRVGVAREEGVAAVDVSRFDVFIAWGWWQQADAYLKQGEPDRALILLQRLFWRDVGAGAGQGEAYIADEDALSSWRILLVRVYLAQNRAADAYVSMLRYHQDYPHRRTQSNLLYARILLSLGRVVDAARVLKGERSGEARTLLYQAQIQAGTVSAVEVRRELESMTKVQKLNDQDEYRLWRLLAQEARKSADVVAEISYLGRALSISVDHAEVADGQEGAAAALSGSELWHAYQSYGMQLGNEMQLLVGHYQAWMAEAQKLQEKASVRAAALYAVVANNADDAVLKREAHSGFARLLSRETHGLVLLRHLYLQVPGAEHQVSARIEDLPDEIRHRLVDEALAQADIRLASQLMGDLQRAPKGKSSFQWGLRRARILIMGGDQERGIAALHTLLDEAAEVSGDELDRLVQVLFDLQSVVRHQEAVELFERVLVVMPEAGAVETKAGQADAKRRREIYYWIADSYKAMERYQDAGRMYLKSAMWIEASAMDPWGQTARYQAADALARAGFRQDAASLYRSLLRVTTEAARRTVLQNRIQQLWLSTEGSVTDASAMVEPPRQGQEATSVTDENVTDEDVTGKEFGQ